MCFLTVKESDRELLKSLPETEVIPSESVAVMVEDSDEESDEYVLPPPKAEVVDTKETVVVSQPVIETPKKTESQMQNDAPEASAPKKKAIAKKPKKEA